MKKHKSASGRVIRRGASRRAGNNLAPAMMCALLAPTQGYGFEAKDLLAFSVGPLVVRPRVGVSETYNDNLFYNSGAEESAFITGVTPAVDVRLGRLDGDRILHFKYDFNQYWYHGVDMIDTAVAHNLALTGTWRGSRFLSDTAFSFGFMDTVYGGYESFEQGAVGSGSNVERTTLNLSQRLRYQISQKTAAYGRFTLNDLDFDESQYSSFYDRNEWRITGGFGYQVRPKVEAIGEVHYGQTSRDPNMPLVDKPPHQETIGGFLGANLSFTTKLSGTAKVGYEQVNAEPNEVGADLDYGAPIAHVSLTSALTERSSATLSYDRRTGASVSSTASAYTSDYLRLQYRHALGTAHPVICTVGGSYGLNSYESRITAAGRQPGYDRDILGANASIAYQPRPWFTVGLYYKYTQSDGSSPWAGVDYAVNEVTLALSLGY